MVDITTSKAALIAPEGESDCRPGHHDHVLNYHEISSSRYWLDIMYEKHIQLIE